MPLRQLFPDPKAASDGSKTVPKVDIIAVHGLNPKVTREGNDHAWDTWRRPAGPQGRLWLRDDLPSSLPDSRIFLYQYDASAAFGKDQDTFIGKANELLEAIRIKRRGMEDTPILFFGHSMGGILIKQALINAHNNPKYTAIKNATCGLAFFATPHGGGDKLLVKLGDVAGKVASKMGFQKGSDVFEVLKSESIFSEILKEHWRHQLLKYDIVSFWGSRDDVVPKESARLGMPGDRENVVKLIAGHGGVCKFGEDETDQDNLELVRANVEDLYQNALVIGANTRDQAVSEQNVPNYPQSLMTPIKTLVQRPILRDAIKEQLFRKPPEGRQGMPMTIGISGLGGVGKSQLILSYLHMYGSKDYRATFWIKASQPNHIEQDFANILRLLFKGSEADPKGLNNQQVVQKVHQWFIGKPGPWLFIFDAADAIDDENHENFVKISDYIPQSPHVHVIITSRSATARELSTFDGIEVGELLEEEATDIFFNCANIKGPKVDQRNEAKLIVDELGYLALAISLAGAYVRQKPRLSSNLPLFLKEYRQQRKKLLDSKAPATQQYAKNIMTAWEMTYLAIERQMPEACRFLTLLSFLDYQDIFLALFCPNLESDSELSSSWTFVISDKEVDVDTIEESCRILEQYSLLQRQANGMDYSLHRLVHWWGYLRVEDKHEELENYMKASIALCRQAVDHFGAEKGRWQDKTRLMPHLQHIFGHLHHLDNPDVEFQINLTSDLNSLGKFANDVRRPKEALKFTSETLRRTRLAFGDDHNNTLTVKQNLAAVLQANSQYSEAREAREEIYERIREIYGDGHRETLLQASAVALGNSFGSEPEEDLERQRRTLQSALNVLEKEDHEYTPFCQGVLGEVLRKQGKLKEAEHYIKKAIRTRQMAGETGGMGLIGMQEWLASTYDDQGKAEEAAELRAEIFEELQGFLNDDNWDVYKEALSVRTILAKQPRTERVEATMRQALDRFKEAFGEGSPETVGMMHTIFSMLHKQKKYDEAIKVGREVAKKEVPDTSTPIEWVTTLSGLASALMGQGELVEAAQILIKLLIEIPPNPFFNYELVLDAGVHALGHMLEKEGEFDTAIKLHRARVEKTRALKGTDNPDVAYAMHELAEALKMQGNASEAETMEKNAVETLKKGRRQEDSSIAEHVRQCGLEVPDTLQLPEADDLMRKEVQSRRARLGDAHPDTVEALETHGIVLLERDNHDGAELLFREVLLTRRKTLDKDDPLTSQAAYWLGATLLSRPSREAEAEVFLTQAATHRKRTAGPTHPVTLSALNLLAIAKFRRNKFDEALAMMGPLVDEYRRTMGPEGEATKQAQSLVVRIRRQREKVEVMRRKMATGRRWIWACLVVYGMYKVVYGLYLMFWK